MNNKRKLILAAIAGAAMVMIAGVIAGFYAIPFAIAAVGAGLMLFGNHLGIYALPVETIALMKKAVRFALIAIVIVWVWNLITSTREKGRVKSTTGGETKPAIMKSDRNYIAEYNFSEIKGDFVPLKVKTPPPGQWASVKLRLGYDVSKSPHGKVIIDYCDGRPLVYLEPGKKVDSGDVPSTFDFTSQDEKSAGKILEIRCYRIKGWSPESNKKVVAKPHKGARFVKVIEKKQSVDRDIPTSPQVM